MMAQRFTKRAVTIEAMQNTGPQAADDILIWMDDLAAGITVDGEIYVNAREGQMQARLNDWVIKGVDGGFYPCDPEVFEKSYQPEASTFLDRLKVEHADLSARLAKLDAFLDTDTYQGLGDLERRDLRDQATAMRTYARILRWRLERATP